MTKDIKLTKVVPWGEKETYREAVLKHLKGVSSDLAESSPNVIFIGSMSNEGMSYHILTDSTPLELMGALDVIKSYCFLDNFGEE